MKKTSILSLSLLTVMAGAAVAPALGVIQENFRNADQLLIQLVISIPAVFIFIMSFIFPGLCGRFRSKTLVLMGLGMYVFGGCAAGLVDNIWAVLAFRAVTGLGVGIIMPLSTGLLAFYYPPEEQDKLMGYSSAMNQMGGVLATLLAGVLAQISWRASFLVYLLGLISIVLCACFLPNDVISRATEPSRSDTKRDGTGTAAEESEELRRRHPLIRYNRFVIAMFLLMTAFFLYPSNFAIEVTSDGIIPAKFIAVIMAFMDLIAFFGGLLFVHIKKAAGRNTCFFSPLLFLIGYLALALDGGWFGAVAGSVFVGFANGSGIPFIISSASRTAGKRAVSTVMPLISAALYMGQFLNPFIMSVVQAGFGGLVSAHLPYWFGVFVSAALLIWSIRLRESGNRS